MTDRATTEAAARRWVQGYEKAWSTNDEADIRALFTDDAQYLTTPFRDPWRGSDAIVAEWLERADTPGGYTFEWDVDGVDGDRAYIAGVTGYAATADEPAEQYSNLWVIDLAADGRARSFTEWWMRHPS